MTSLHNGFEHDNGNEAVVPLTARLGSLAVHHAETSPAVTSEAEPQEDLESYSFDGKQLPHDLAVDHARANVIAIGHGIGGETAQQAAPANHEATDQVDLAAAAAAEYVQQHYAA
jgi:hypothetical protein